MTLLVLIGSVAGAGLDLIFAIVGVVLAVFALYLVVLVVAALFYRDRTVEDRAGRAHSRLVVLIPAHNERDFIARSIESLRQQTYPRELWQVVVIADNCTDDTAEVASAEGAEVLVRDEPDSRGKGHALEWAIDRILAHASPPDAVVIMDADSIADPDFLETLVRRFEAGGDAVQGESLLADEGSADAALRAAAFLLVNRARPSGRAVLHLPAGLSGNGMLFSRQLLIEQPWSAFSSTEDVEYSIKLRIAGVRPVFARGAIVRSPVAPQGRAADLQQLRWEGGKLHLGRTQIPHLIALAFRDRRPSLLDAAFELAVPPVGYLAAGAGMTTITGAALAWLDGLALWALGPSVLALASIPVYVLVGFRAAEAPRSAYRALARAPVFVARKTLTAYRLLRFRADSWVRTERPSD